MRLIIFVFLLAFTVPAVAQNMLQQNYSDYPQSHLTKDSGYTITPAKKWFVSKYAGLSAGFGFFNGGNATVLAAPFGVQLNRRLTNNWYAFAGISAAPAYISFNHSFLSANTNKSSQNNGLLTSNRFDMYSRAEMGLMYINDQKTFSISGSIGIEKSNYPFGAFGQSATTRPNTFIAPRK